MEIKPIRRNDNRTVAFKERTPRTKGELKKTIEFRLGKYGNECGLDDMNVSLMTDMGYLFHKTRFNGDISKSDSNRS